MSESDTTTGEGERKGRTKVRRRKGIARRTTRAAADLADGAIRAFLPLPRPVPVPVPVRTTRQKLS